MILDIIKNIQSAPNMGKRYGQDVEPKGTYVLAKTSDYLEYPWVKGKADLKKPLIIDITDETQISYKNDLVNQYKAKGMGLTKKLMSKGYDAIITRYDDGSTGEIILFPNANFMLDKVNEGKQLIKTLLRENLQQADKLYFNSGKLSPQDREVVLSITHGDNFTRLVADWLHHLIKIWKEDINSPSTSIFVKEFYNNLKTYDKNILPLAYDLNEYTALTDERDKHVLDLFSCLKNRRDAIKQLNQLPSIAKRNLKDIIRKPESNEYAFQALDKKFRDLNRSIESLPKNSDKYEQMLNKIFSSKNSLDDMIKTASHYVNAFNVDGEEIGKEEVIEGLEYINADLVQNSGDILVIKVNDNEAMQHIGCTSLWCFSRPNSSGYWDDYAPYGFVYVIFDFGKDFEDATFMMTYLPDSGSVYSSTNVPLEELDIDDGYNYLHSIGVNLDGLNDGGSYEEPEERKEYQDSKQLSLFEIKQKLREVLLPEATKGQTYTVYHGSPQPISNFSDEFVGGKEATDQEGPGIYLTSSIQDAKAYGENVYTITISPRKLFDLTPSSNRLSSFISKMVFMAPHWASHAQNYNENPREGVRNFVESTIDYNDTEKDVAQQIWIDFYRDKPIDFVRNMVKMGVDGLLIPRNDGVTHFIIYNPSIIKIQN